MREFIHKELMMLISALTGLISVKVVISNKAVQSMMKNANLLLVIALIICLHSLINWMDL